MYPLASQAPSNRLRRAPLLLPAYTHSPRRCPSAPATRPGRELLHANVRPSPSLWPGRFGPTQRPDKTSNDASHPAARWRRRPSESAATEQRGGREATGGQESARAHPASQPLSPVPRVQWPRPRPGPGALSLLPFFCMDPHSAQAGHTHPPNVGAIARSGRSPQPRCGNADLASGCVALFVGLGCSAPPSRSSAARRRPASLTPSLHQVESHSSNAAAITNFYRLLDSVDRLTPLAPAR